MRFDKRFAPDLVAGKDFSRGSIFDRVELDVEGRSLLATSGTQAIAVPCVPDAGDTSGPLSPKAVRDARRQCRKSEGVAWVRGDEHEERPAFAPLDRAMPTFKQGDKGTVSIALDASLLLELARALRSDDPCVVLTFQTKQIGYNPILVESMRPVADEAEFADRKLAKAAALDKGPADLSPCRLPVGALMPCAL